jgi:hypothetical protein
MQLSDIDGAHSKTWDSESVEDVEIGGDGMQLLPRCADLVCVLAEYTLGQLVDAGFRRCQDRDNKPLPLYGVGECFLFYAAKELRIRDREIDIPSLWTDCGMPCRYLC